MAEGGSSPIEVTLDQRALANLEKQLKGEADGRELRQSLIQNLKKAAAPTVQALKASINGAPSQGGKRDGGSLRQAIAASIKPETRLSGNEAGVTLRQAKTSVRGFALAGSRFNKGSFKHKVYGRDVWVTQHGDPGWFDNTVKGRHDDFARGAQKAVEDLAKVLAERTNMKGT